jgi:hypothetical protein
MNDKELQIRERAVLQATVAVELCCSKCDYDEAEGALINHCDACCRVIVQKLWKRRELAARRVAPGKNINRKRKYQPRRIRESELTA